ncbi:hypothetical protein Godav_000588 [Gossypium davidsonii]|uniref:Uncharacterized protein n=1 Tax=Gossypium davidsonii TaxID=34287 RepID=A0A7J8T070_GOSDV|nr:hypothetical protein [Gossypium davidsonii]
MLRRGSQILSNNNANIRIMWSQWSFRMF